MVDELSLTVPMTMRRRKKTDWAKASTKTRWTSAKNFLYLILMGEP